jgi:flagellar assembly factor FliW
MTPFETKNFGQISYSHDAVIEFPGGLPGFENQRRFLLVRFEHTDPLVFLQSLEDSTLCFLTLPARSVDPDYRLRLEADDLAALGLSLGRQPHIGDEVVCLTVLSLRETGPTANLLAPIVVNLRNLKAVQAVNPASGYPLQYELESHRAMACS